LSGITGATPLRVFLSHTADLGKPDEAGSFVAAAVAAVLRARTCIHRHGVLRRPRDTSPVAVCVDMVVQSDVDVYVGIVGLRYDSTVRERPDLSYSERRIHLGAHRGQIDGRVGSPGERGGGNRRQDILKVVCGIARPTEVRESFPAGI
jgi:hypothetical protein